MKLKNIMPVMEAAWRNQQTLELVGPPGIGKTAIMYQFAEHMAKKTGKPFGILVEYLSTMESIDLRGLPHVHQTDDGKFVSMYAMPPVFPSENKFADGVIPEQGILFLDEYRQAPQDVRKPSARILDERKVGDYSLDDFGHWSVMAASNRTQDKSGVNKQMMFEINRKIELHIVPDLGSWTDWAEKQNINPMIVAYAKAHPHIVFTEEVPEKEGPFPTPRSLVRTGDMLTELGKTSPTTAHHGLPLEDANAIEVTAGLLGDAAAATMLSYLTMASELPSFDEIVSNPQRAKCPGMDRADACHAISATCSFMVTAKTAGPVFQYVQRMPNEFQVATLSTAARRNPALVQNVEFSNWIKENQNMLAAVASQL